MASCAATAEKIVTFNWAFFARHFVFTTLVLPFSNRGARAGHMADARMVGVPVTAITMGAQPCGQRR